MSCGTNTVESTSSPPAAYLNAYSNVLGQAQQTAAAPLQTYPGQIVQGFSPDQTNAFSTVAGASQPIAQAGSTVAGAAGAANPYLSQAQTNLTAATAPLWNGVQQFSPQAVSQYESPYTQQVVNATQAEFNNQNQQQSNALNGSAAAAGAFGGDRTAVAQAQLAGQQQLAQAPTIANLENQGYSTALGEFNTQQQSQLQANEADSWLNSQAGFGEMNLGQEAQNLPLTEAQAQLGIGSAQLGQASAQLQTGGLEQQLGQENLNVPYEEFLQQQAYPFQTTNYLAGIAEGTGSAAGGTSSTSSPGQSAISDLSGLGVSGLALNQLGAFDGLFGSTLNTGAINAGLSGAADTLEAGSSSLLPGAADAGSSLLSLLGFAARGGAIRPHANGGNVIPFRRGGMVPVRRDAGGMLPYQQIPVTPDIPNVSVQFVPESGGQSRGMGIPRAPGAYQQQDPFNSQQMMQVGNLLKNSNSGSGGMMQRGGKIRRYADGGMADDGDDDVPTPIPRPAQPSDPVAQPVGMTPQNFGFTAPTPITLNPQKADPNMALLAAGLGMLGGTSPHPLQNIGRGAMLGLQEYQQNQRQNETDAEKQANVDIANSRNNQDYQSAVVHAKQLADDLEQRRDQMKQSENNFQQTFAQTQKNEDQQRKDRESQLDLGWKKFAADQANVPSNDPVTVNPDSGSILAQTGLSLNAFRYLTGGASQLPRDKATRNAAAQEAQNWANKNGIDVSTFATQYAANNDVLGKNIQRNAQSKVMENEILGTVQNLKPVADAATSGSLQPANVAELYAGKKVNDPTVQQYSFYLGQLRNELAAYNAALSGRSSTQLDDRDYREAESTIMNGLSSKGAGGLESAVRGSTSKMGNVLGQSVDAARKSVWDQFGVGKNYKPQFSGPQNLPLGQSGTIDPSQLVNGTAYQTNKGVGTWDAKTKTFIPVAQ